MKLKQTLLALALAGGLVPAMEAPSHAFEIFGIRLFGGNAKVEVQSHQLLRRTYLATGLFMQSAADLYDAAGKKEEAERARSVANQLQSADTKKADVLKDVSSEVDTTGKSLQNELKLAGKLTQEQQAKLLSAATNLGVATLINVIAVKDAADLTQSTAQMIQGAASNPMQLVSLKTVAETAGYVASFVPTQASSIQNITGSLQTYFAAHGLPMPSPEELKKAMESADKQ